MDFRDANQTFSILQALHNVASSNNDLKKYALTDEEWDFIEEIHKLMKVLSCLISFSVNGLIIWVDE